MTIQASPPLSVAPSPARARPPALARGVALDVLRRLAGWRETGAFEQAETALAELRAHLPPDVVHHVFGLFCELVLADARRPSPVAWRPTGARRPSGGEIAILARAMTRLGAVATPAPQSWCAAAERDCGLAPLQPSCAAAQRCPFDSRDTD